MLNKALKGKFGMLSSLRNSLQKPKNAINQMSIPQSGYYSRFESTELGFEEVAEEYIANYTELTYELSGNQSSDFYNASNFGTIDNPHLIFTQNYPYRYVGCTGQPNEDEYEGHELFWFVLREGPMQRCTHCGQVFKLVRLRNDHEENMYYQSYQLSQNLEDLGSTENIWHLSPRATQTNFSYPTKFEDDTSHVYSLINPDDHDHYLVDPAYRLHKAQQTENALSALLKVQGEVARTYMSQNQEPQETLSRRDYENLVEAEIAMKQWTENSKKVFKFNLRQLIDPRNHQRREQRMLERNRHRVQAMNTVYLNGKSENELCFEDYYETDLELEGVVNKSQQVEQFKSEILDDISMNIKNINFMENVSNGASNDSSSMIQNLMFKYKYRKAFDDEETFHLKEARRIQVMNQNVPLILKKLNDFVSAPENEQKAKELEYYECLTKVALDNLNAYFGAEEGEELYLVNQLPLKSQIILIESLEHEPINELLRENQSSQISLQKDNKEDSGVLFSLAQFMKEAKTKLVSQIQSVDEINFNPGLVRKLQDLESKNETSSQIEQTPEQPQESKKRIEKKK